MLDLDQLTIYCRVQNCISIGLEREYQHYGKIQRSKNWGTEISSVYFLNDNEHERLEELVTDHKTDSEHCDNRIQ